MTCLGAPVPFWGPAARLPRVPSQPAVTVCTNREPGAISESLEALREVVPEGRLALVTSGLGDDAVARHRAAAGPGVEVLVEPEAGLARARNRALAWSPDPVIAFVDDDAVVDARWYTALSLAWDDAPESVACIGGPIRPRYAVPPPAWLSAPILPALTLIDLGPEIIDLDPTVTTVYGANVSFRVGPLREVGGFDPAFGHSGRRVFFAEEDEAQRALARAGYGIRWVPAPAVEHLIPAERLTRRSFLRRRFAYGATLGVRRARRRRVALRQALSSSAGCVVAAALRRDALLMERAVRVAENAGVLLAPLVARGR